MGQYFFGIKDKIVEKKLDDSHFFYDYYLYFNLKSICL